MWQCDDCGETVLDDDSVVVYAADGRGEYVYHEYCWDVIKKEEEWYEDYNGELHFGDGDPSDDVLLRVSGGSIDSDPVYRQQMKDAGRGSLLR